MNTKLNIAVLGDYDETSISHQCISNALRLAGNKLLIETQMTWIETKDLVDVNHLLEKFNGIWVTPGSPYKNRNGVLEAIKFARLNNIPYIGTCGGYQHAILEFAKNELELTEADLEEENPNTSMPLISALSRRLNSERKKIHLHPESQMTKWLNAEIIEEEYQCGFGMNRKYQPLFANSNLKFVAFNEEKQAQGFELLGHPFFIATAFQPERSARFEKSHKLIEAYVRAASCAGS
ncbi:hypothetical protein CIK05_08070 [Bdellovibrio sp. qaytius]|nr:hypothetical protein CIK05_08070 [Bdellovibrio sp. qaytius]